MIHEEANIKISFTNITTTSLQHSQVSKSSLQEATKHKVFKFKQPNHNKDTQSLKAYFNIKLPSLNIHKLTHVRIAKFYLISQFQPRLFFFLFISFYFFFIHIQSDFRNLNTWTIELLVIVIYVKYL